MIAENSVGPFKEYSKVLKKKVSIHLVMAAVDRETSNLTLSMKKSPVFLIDSKTSIVASGSNSESSRYFLILARES